MTAATLEQAYAFCRSIAKAEAKNFYYAFRVLPQAKSDAMCAVYAFMRRADDIADDESTALPLRRQIMADWLDAYRSARAGAATGDLVIQALCDTQRRFNIPDALLEDLVRGTTIDLTEKPAGVEIVRLQSGKRAEDQVTSYQVYETFEDLYRYCYLVASVVGLVCIRIFGYSDPRAELLAEKTGVAFQLTNILRDVKEDAERGRVYLPMEMLREFGVRLEDLLVVSRGGELKPNQRALLMALSVQAWEYYAAAEQLLPMIDADSRGALWVLVEIYSGLLKRIDRRQGDVFSERVRVPAARKMIVLARGALMSVRAPRSIGRGGT